MAPTIRKILLNDLYRPHGREELEGLVSGEALARMGGAEEAGVWWFGRKQVKITGHSLSDPDENGERRYKQHTTTTLRPKEERVGVSVPAYLQRGLVDRARASLAANRPTERKPGTLAREWELRGLIRCSCGWKLGTHTARSGGNGRLYSYYTCNRRSKMGPEFGCSQGALRAEDIEAQVWEFVSGWLADPAQVVSELDRRIEEEKARTGDPDREERRLRNLLDNLDGQRTRAQDGYLAGAFEVDELNVKLEALKEQRQAIERELEACKNRGERVRQLEEAREFYAREGEIWETLDEMREWTSPKHLDETDDEYGARLLEVERAVEQGAERYERILDRKLDEAQQARLLALQNATPEQRREHYRGIGLAISRGPDGGVEVFGERLFCTTETPLGTG